jgi:hypothetical protein
MGGQMTRALLFGLVACAYVALAVVKTLPLSRHFTTHLPSDLGDPLLTTWIMAWGSHALAHHPFSLFDANLLYPLDRTLAFSDHLLGVLPVFAPVYAATGNPIAAANTVFLLSFALSAFAAFCLTYMLTSAPWPSFLAGLLFGFAPFRFGQLSHMQLLNFFWCPLALSSLLMFLQTRRKAALAFFGVFYCLQVLSSAYLAFMTSVAVIVVVVVFAIAVDRSASRWEMVWPALVCAAAVMVVLVPTHLPYLAVHRAWDASWTPRAMVGMSADLRSYVSAPPLSSDAYASLLQFSDRPGGHELRLFPGLVLPVLALLGGMGTVTTVAAPIARAVRIIFGVLCGVAVILSLGPYLVIPGTSARIPLPYLALHYAVPGWAGMRVPARFALLAVLAATPLAALGAIWIGERIARSRRVQRWRARIPALVSLALAALFLGELGMKPLPLVPSPTEPEVPRVYSWLAGTGAGPLLELPLDQPSDQRYSLLSTTHWRQIVNGRSGFMPPTHDDLRAVLATFPSPRALEYAAAIGLGTIVVHAGHVSVDQRARLRVAEEAGSVHRVAEFGEDLAYGIGGTSVAPASLSIDVAVPPALPAQRQSRLGLRVRATAGASWMQRRPQGLSTVILEWERDGGGRTRREEVRVALPLVVTADEEIPVSMRARAPEAGRYLLRVSIPAMGLVAPAKSVAVMAGGPHAGDRPGASLVAAYEIERPREQLQGSRATFMRLAVTAINQGEAIWLSNASRNAEMTLQYRWLGTRASDDAVESPVRLVYEVFPGQRYTFHLEIPLPVQPGTHILELGLVSAGVAAFGSLGSDPLRLTVDVR